MARTDRFAQAPVLCALLSLVALEAAAAVSPGSKDTGWQASGEKTLSSWEIDGYSGGLGVRDLVWDPHGGRMLAVGWTEHAAGDDRLLVVALGENGDLDPSFGFSASGWRDFDQGGSASHERAYAAVVDPATGNIFLAGSSDFLGNDDLLVGALQPNGMNLFSFSASGLRSFPANLVAGGGDSLHAILWDGSGVIVGGDAASTGGVPDRDIVVLRVKTDGSADTTWGIPNLSQPGMQIFHPDIGGGKQDTLSAMARTADGKILVAGTVMTSGPPYTYDFVVFRLLANGMIDTSFGINGYACVDFSDASNSVACDSADNDDSHLNAMAVMPDGRIVLAGRTEGASSVDLAVARLQANGSLDTTFASTVPQGRREIALDFGGIDYDEVRAVDVQGDGRVVLVGSTRFPNDGNGEDDAYFWMRLLESGENDIGFGFLSVGWEDWDSAGDEQDAAHAVLRLPNGELIVAGDVAGSSGLVGDYGGLIKLQNDFIFADGFEIGDVRIWSSSAP